MLDLGLLPTLLLAATLKGSLLILGVWCFLRWRPGSAHRRHRLLFLALLSPVVLVVGLAGVPGDDLDRGTDGHALASARYTATAAGKFADLTGPRGADPTGEPSSTHPALSPALAVPATEGPRSWSLGAILQGVWALGAALLLARLVLRFGALRELLGTTRPVDDPRVLELFESVAAPATGGSRVRLVTSPRVTTPWVWGPPRPVLVLPETLLDDPADDLRMVFLHELSHVRRWDTLTHLVADLVCCVFWFNPLVWHTAARLRHEQELAADSEVVSQGIRPSTYSSYLVRQLRRAQRGPAFLSSQTVSPLGAKAMLGKPVPSHRRIEHRLLSILDARSDHRRLGRVASLAWSALFLVAIGLLAPLDANTALAAVRAGATDGGSPAWTQEALERELAPIFHNKMAEHRIAGAAIVVVKDGEVVYQRGFGQRDVFAEAPVVPDRTIFRIGSISKVMTGVAVMQLVDRGLIDLEADVNTYLEDFKVDDTFPEPVRVKHLLTHTAGFDQLGHGRHVMARSQVLPLGEFLRDNLVRVRPPGTVSCYDTYGITLAGYLVEVVSGLSFEEYLVQNLFEPLGMFRSNIVIPKAITGDVATGYVFQEGWHPQRWEFMNTDPASTVNSTVTDMARFVTMMLADGALGDTRVLSADAVQAMLRQQHTNHPELPGYGLTFFEESGHGVRAMGHGGSMTGYAAGLFLAPDHDLGIFLAYNQESGRLAQQVIRTLAQRLDPDRPAEPAPRADWDEPVDLERYTGRYANNMYNHTTLEQRGGWAPRPFDFGVGDSGQLELDGEPLRPVGDNLFQSDQGLLVAFLEDAGGKVTHMLVNQTVYERW